MVLIKLTRPSWNGLVWRVKVEGSTRPKWVKSHRKRADVAHNYSAEFLTIFTHREVLRLKYVNIQTYKYSLAHLGNTIFISTKKDNIKFQSSPYTVYVKWPNRESYDQAACMPTTKALIGCAGVNRKLSDQIARMRKLAWVFAIRI